MRDIHKLLFKFIPLRFILFAIVGLMGTGVHLLTLWAVHLLAELQFLLAQTIATYVAMTSNYFINNNFTYRDQRIRGRKLMSGLLSFYLVCSFGAVINIESANFVYLHQQKNWVIAALVGAFAGSICNYYFSSLFTWKNKNI
ncbi:MAG: GtrA family protein [Methylomicrobium sp.]